MRQEKMIVVLYSTPEYKYERLMTNNGPKAVRSKCVYVCQCECAYVAQDIDKMYPVIKKMVYCMKSVERMLSGYTIII